MAFGWGQERVSHVCPRGRTGSIVCCRLHWSLAYFQDDVKQQERLMRNGQAFSAIVYLTPGMTYCRWLFRSVWVRVHSWWRNQNCSVRGFVYIWYDIFSLILSLFCYPIVIRQPSFVTMELWLILWISHMDAIIQPSDPVSHSDLFSNRFRNGYLFPLQTVLIS